MVSSALISKRRQLEAQIRRCNDPQRKQQLLAQLLGIERDVGRLFGNYSKEELNRNDFGESSKTIEGKQIMIPTPGMWSTSTNEEVVSSAPNQQTHQDRRQAYKAEVEGRAAMEAGDDRRDFWDVQRAKVQGKLDMV
jgi:hypothetical protein